jgi:hypothetical protein
MASVAARGSERPKESERGSGKPEPLVEAMRVNAMLSSGNLNS